MKKGENKGRTPIAVDTSTRSPFFTKRCKRLQPGPESEPGKGEREGKRKEGEGRLQKNAMHKILYRIHLTMNFSTISGKGGDFAARMFKSRTQVTGEGKEKKGASVHCFSSSVTMGNRYAL